MIFNRERRIADYTDYTDCAEERREARIGT